MCRILLVFLFLEAFFLVKSVVLPFDHEAITLLFENEGSNVLILASSDNEDSKIAIQEFEDFSKENP